MRGWCSFTESEWLTGENVGRLPPDSRPRKERCIGRGEGLISRDVGSNPSLDPLDGRGQRAAQKRFWQAGDGGAVATGDDPAGGMDRRSAEDTDSPEHEQQTAPMEKRDTETGATRGKTMV